MFCPVCSQQQISEQSRFCSRCGFLLTGVTQLIERGGAPLNFSSAEPGLISPRRRGVKQGALLMLSSLLFVPLTAMITLALGIEPFLVAIAAIVTFWGGILRMLYAVFFESSLPSIDRHQSVLPAFLSKKIPGNKQNAPSLPAANDYPGNYIPPVKSDWRETNELVPPPSVTDHTTKFLTRE